MSAMNPSQPQSVSWKGATMKPALLGVFALCFGLAQAALAAEQAATRVAASDPRFLYEGRIDTRDPEGPVLIWQGSRAEIDFDGRTLGLEFDHAKDQNFFDVHVDGQVWVAEVPAGGPSRVEYPLPLSPGRHHLSLNKRQEAAAGTVQFKGIDIAKDARAWRPAAPVYTMAMEFYGDSITAGACDEDGDTDQWESRRTHNAEKSYAVLTAQAFGADCRNISISGIGVVTGWIDPVAGQTWNRLYPSPDSPVVDLTRWVPDVVLVDLGDNDADYPKAHGKSFPEGFADRYCELIGAIRKGYPKTQIVLMMGGMYSGSQSAPLNEAWRQAVERLEASDPRIHDFTFRHWTMNHPRVADHQALAAELIPWLRQQEFMLQAGSTTARP